MLKVKDSRAGAKITREEDPTTSEDERIYRDIFLAITEQKLLPGTKLKEDQLCDIYEVSRARIREILSRLSHDKIVTRISNRGAFVAEPTVEEAREVFAARRLIEGHLVRLLAERKDTGSSEALEAQLESERRARADGTFSEIIREAGAFHLALAELAESPILGGFLRELISRTSLISAAYERGVPAKCELDEHRELSACIAEGRAEDAVAMMAAHLDGIESRLDLTPPREPQASLGEILGRR
jgi:DNA-binding GntR family transcriptional regulator